MKVYCRDCRYRMYRPIFDECLIYEETDDEIPENHDHPAYVRRTKRTPLTSMKNKHNDCQDFRKKLTLIIWEKIKSWVK